MGRPVKNENKKSAKDKLLDAAFEVIRTKGYTATTVDDLCEHAGVTKGTFFHYFETKEALAVTAAQHWSVVTQNFFATAPYQKKTDPLDRILGYLDFRKEIVRGQIPEFTCLVGTMVQEAYDSHPDIRKACKESIFGHAEGLEVDLGAAKKKYAPKSSIDVKSLALHTQAVIQGAFILAKASENKEVVAQQIEHLKNYFKLVFKNN